MHRSTLLGKRVAFGRFEADYQNEIWVGDALHAQVIEGKKAILFCYLDDYSRLVTGFKFTHIEDTLSGQHAQYMLSYREEGYCPGGYQIPSILTTAVLLYQSSS